MHIYVIVCLCGGVCKHMSACLHCVCMSCGGVCVHMGYSVCMFALSMCDVCLCVCVVESVCVGVSPCVCAWVHAHMWLAMGRVEGLHARASSAQTRHQG